MAGVVALAALAFPATASANPEAAPKSAPSRTLSAVVQMPVEQASAARVRMNRRVFDRVWQEVRRSYYDPGLHGVDWNAARDRFRPQASRAVDDRALYAVLDEMLALLDDDHARASSPAAVRRLEGQYEATPALGLTLRRADVRGSWAIDRVRPESPAEEAGLQPGWTLAAIDNRPWDVDINLEAGRTVLLGLVDETGAHRSVPITPRVMERREPFAADTAGTGELVLTIERFEPGLGRWIGARLAEVSPDTGIVIDLRANPGGRLWEAESLLTCFLPRDQAWATQTWRSGRPVTLTAAGDCGSRPVPAQNPVVVLVDAYSRSAAELAPAALQEARRAVVVGEQTIGSVLVARDTPLPDGGRLTLSRANIVTSGGVRLEKRGVTPDILVVRTDAQRRTGDDPMLDAALTILQSGS